MPELVKHRGVSVAADWPARIAAAQELTHYSSRRRRVPRIRYGEDDQRWGEVPCHDCAVIKGEFHVPDCEYEHCPVCRDGPLQSCDCPIDELGREPSSSDMDKGREGDNTRLLSRRMLIVGWLCALGICLVIVDLVRLLPELPAGWWQPEQPLQLDAHGMQLELRAMAVDFGMGWIGSWGYLGAFVWLAVALTKAVRVGRIWARSTAAERILFFGLCGLLCATSALVHLTPLRYAQYNIPLL